jgi:hypothetical protein
MIDVQRFTYWALIVHLMKFLYPQKIPNTLPLAMFVAIVGEGINLFLKDKVNRTKDTVTHLLPLILVSYKYRKECCKKDSVYLVIGLVGVYFVYNGCNVTNIKALYE